MQLQNWAINGLARFLRKLWMCPAAMIYALILILLQVPRSGHDAFP